MNELVRGDSNIALMQAAKQEAVMRAQMKDKEASVPNFKKIEAAAQDFEATYLAEMMKPMFAEVNKSDPLFGGGKGEEVFNGMLVQEYAKIMAQRGGIGIAEHVKAELLKIQEAQQGTALKNTATVKETE